jgi:hypothetical protein
MEQRELELRGPLSKNTAFFIPSTLPTPTTSSLFITSWLVVLYLAHYSCNSFCVLGYTSFQNALTLGFYIGLNEEGMNNVITRGVFFAWHNPSLNYARILFLVFVIDEPLDFSLL